MRYFVLLLLAIPLLLAGTTACSDDGEYESGCDSGEGAADDYFLANEDDVSALDRACVDNIGVCPDEDTYATTWEEGYDYCCQSRRDWYCQNVYGY